MDNVGICSDVNQAIWQVFRQNGIEIPFPQSVQYTLDGLPEGPQSNLGGAKSE
jgi:small-conductance mechanosensitive channel